MTKTQLIADIRRLNRSACPEFLEQFEENELDVYLRRLLDLARARGGGDLLQPVAAEDLLG